VLLALLAITLLCGCGGDQDPGVTTTMVIDGKGDYVAWGETATILDGVAMTAYPPQVDPLATPIREGNVVVYCMIEITNGADEAFPYDQKEFTLDAKGEGSTAGWEGRLTVSEPPLLSGTLEPGETVRGALPFEFSPEAVSTIHDLMFGRLVVHTLWVAKWSARD
jgi:hypothetical protein